MRQPSAELDALLDSLKRCAAALRDREIPYMVGGGLGAWARGGPESTKDLDLMVKPADAERALAALEELGLRPERPPEGWLLKAWDGELLVDLIFQPRGMEIDDEALGRAELLNVKSMEVPVMALEDVFSTKLLALNEHYMDYDQLLAMARALREQVEWDAVRARTAGSPFARAFFVLTDGLAITGWEPVSPAGVAGT